MLRLAPWVVRRVARKAAFGVEYDDLLRLARDLRLLELARLLRNHPGIRSRRCVTSVSTASLLALEREAARRGHGHGPSLVGYWILDLPSASRSAAGTGVLRRLRRSSAPSVAGFFPEEGLADPAPLPPRSDLRIEDQHYLDPAPTGIDARYAWSRGFAGQGTRLVDLEEKWHFGHPNLNGNTLGRDPHLLFFGDNYLAFPRDCPDHGTEVLGVVVATPDPGDAGRGILGVAPRIDWVGAASRYDATTGSHWNVADAVIASIGSKGSRLRPGDVLLIEVETASRQPIERDPTVFKAISTAVGNGIAVVEAAGNGGKRWRRSSEARRDSGATVVGAAATTWPRSRRASAHRRRDSSNWGSRVDCYAWGETVLTTTLCASYEPDFGQTSAASAIIAGAALLAQQMHQRARSRKLAPAELRAVLSDPRLGTPSVDDAIGHMPDLRRIERSFRLDDP